MSIDNPEVLKELSVKLTESVNKMSLIKESFIFDYFENKKLDIMKVLTDKALSINGVNIEGL